MKSILFILPELNRGGSQNVVLNLAKRLIDDKIQCSLIYITKHRDVMRADFEKAGVNVFWIDYSRFLKGFGSMRKLVQKLKPSVIHSHVPTAALGFHFALRFSSKAMIINTVHIKQEYGLVFKLNTFFSQFFIGRFVYVSEYTKIWHSCYFNIFWPKKSVIYNGVTLKGRQKRSARNIPIKLVTVANFHAYKGYGACLEVIAEMKKRNVPFTYHICGEGTDAQREVLSKKIVDLGLGDVIVLHGMVPDVGVVLKDAFLFLLLSEHEMFPMSILEALSFGVPVVASNVGGIPEIFGCSKEIGKLVRANNKVEIVDFIEGLAKNEEQWLRLSDGARGVAGIFSQELMYKKHMCAYNGFKISQTSHL